MSFQKDTSARDGGRQVRHQVHGLGDIRKCGCMEPGDGWTDSGMALQSAGDPMAATARPLL